MQSFAMDSPVGRLTVEEEDGAIVRLRWTPRAVLTASEPATPLLREARRQLAAYFERRLPQDFDLPVRPRGSAFEQAVWRRMQKIPYGGTATYGEMAKDLDGIARAVGGACGANPIPIVIPCHRVVGGGNGWGGYSGRGGVETKSFLLALEGATLL
ncbi:MAG: methylated-DNA--[protein]-cysteine S-methyltransferase [Reyranellaceae bacterium]